jgi:uncharacterized protein (DUF2141 family)
MCPGRTISRGLFFGQDVHAAAGTVHAAGSRFVAPPWPRAGALATIGSSPHRAKDPTMKLTHLLAIALVSAGTGGTAAALTLTIEVAGARSAQGSVNAALYASETGWLKVDNAVQAHKLPSAGDKTVLVFTGLAPGRYALSAYHDENGNGRLDTNVLGMPTERYAFTGSPTMGAPSFGEAVIDVQADTTLQLTLR